MKTKLTWARLALLAFFCLTLQNNINAQVTLASLTEAYNAAIKGSNEEPEAALPKIEAVIEQAQELGAEGNEILGLAQAKLPTLNYKVAYNMYKAKDYNGAIEGFTKALDVATEQGNENVAKKSKNVLSKLYYREGSGLIKEKDYEGALALFQRSQEMNPEYGKAYFGLARAYRYLGDMDNMIANTDIALEKGDDKTKTNAIKNIANFFYKKAQALNKKGDHQGALSMVARATSYDKEGDQSRYHFQTGKAKAGLGNTDEACAAYKLVTNEKLVEAAKYEIEHTLQCQ
ncbi:MAG: tetratricopeptide repeat protein [Bacteroidota bacterium]